MAISPATVSIISSGAQACAAIVLAIITYKQIKWASKSVESMERSTQAGFLPILMLDLYPSSDDKKLNIDLTNCGKGLAIKPKIIFPGQPDLLLNSINVGEKDNATIDYSTDYVLKKVSEDERKIVIEYHDVFGRKIVTEANLIERNNLGLTKDRQGVTWEAWTPIIPSS